MILIDSIKTFGSYLILMSRVLSRPQRWKIFFRQMLREKTMAAYNAGVHTVLIPADNERDLEDIDPTARQALTFIPVKDAGEVLKNALL